MCAEQRKVDGVACDDDDAREMLIDQIHTVCLDLSACLQSLPTVPASSTSAGLLAAHDHPSVRLLAHRCLRRERVAMSVGLIFDAFRLAKNVFEFAAAFKNYLEVRVRRDAV